MSNTNQITAIKAHVEECGPGTRNEDISFGIFDKMGRECGLHVRTFPVNVTEAPEDARSWHVGFTECGHYICLQAMAMRNGECYGACQPPSYFKTQAEADAAIAARIKTCRARYAKKFPVA